MVRLIVLVSALFAAAGCDADVGADAGSPDGRTTIDGEVTLCARDLDCDDGLFCTGVERCMPGAAGAASNGCVPPSAPCAAGERCDEPAGRCVAASCDGVGENGCPRNDADCDGVVRIECIGSDCGDDDANRYPGNTEICDVGAHDEDCDIATAGPDLDRDGFESDACCNEVLGERRCGDDCDDGDPAVNPSRVELCNGSDDDCNEAVDNGFDCVQNETRLGQNACGREGTRRCNESCGWLDDTFILAETAAMDTCDYCADAGDNLESEASLATSVANLQILGPYDTPSFAFGTYSCVTPYCCQFWSCAKVRLISRTQYNLAGAFFHGLPRQIGYDTMELTVTVNITTNADADPARGWAFVVVPESAGPPDLGSPSRLGTPSARVGWSAEVLFDASPSTVLNRSNWDMVRLRYLADDTALSTSALIANDVNRTAGGGTVGQTLTIRINADLPWTAANETRIEARYATHPDVLPALPAELLVQCTGDSCRSRILPGDRFYLGASGSTGGSPNAVTMEIGTTLDFPPIAGTARGLCP